MNSRDERQYESVQKWLNSGGKASIVACTGLGKSYIALKAIKAIRKKYPTMQTLIVVPTTLLKIQWEELLEEFKMNYNIEVKVMMGASQKKYTCDLLIIDEYLSI